MLDYYLISGNSTILVEEFQLCDDFTASGINSVEWAPSTGWRSAGTSSRGIRADAGLRSRVTPMSREAAARTYALLGGGELAPEEALRPLLQDHQPLPAATPLDLGLLPEGTRRYRVLFAGELGERELAGVRAALGLEPGPQAGATLDGHVLTWELRQVAAGIAWCLDVTVQVGAGPLSAVGSLLDGHRQTIRERGLIPVTIERFA
ncbi:hypothetical protein [Nonomuraea rhizosphaerae]|uniref:hypothetical protein n=1 Tax=Nonomuraea rhizosphaerae TaxID=2665663 RepID=UPI001C5F34E8|nr:hypothetical protein [Nonomuraea rhizosphaerae]